VTAGHLVARLKLALHGDKHLHHLQDARSQLVAALQLFLAVLELLDDRLDGGVVLRLGRLQLLLAGVVGNRELPPLVTLNLTEQFLGDVHALLQTLGVAAAT
jgi:hypothetical protein